MRKIKFNILKISLLILSFTSFFISPSSGAQNLDCPDRWQIPETSGNLLLIDKNFQTGVLADRLSEGALAELKSGLADGIKYLLISDFNFAVPEAYIQKIGSNSSAVVIQTAWKTSIDSKNWNGLVATHPGNLLPSTELFMSGIPPANVDRKSLARSVGLDRYFPITSASRMGMVSGKYLSFEMVITVQGCKPFTIHERISKIPSYKIETQNLETLISNYYQNNPTANQINFVSLEKCLESFNQLVQNIKIASSKNTNWQISNTSRGVLDLAWSPTKGENFVCWDGVARSKFPFFDLSLNPSLGDSCFVRLDPYKSSHSYKTLTTPCSVSIDSFGFEVGRFFINKPPGSTSSSKNQKRITCVKGNIKKQITGSRPVCPLGYKQN